MTDSADKTAELEQYGVWVKTPPVDITDSFASTADIAKANTQASSFTIADLSQLTQDDSVFQISSEPSIQLSISGSDDDTMLIPAESSIVLNVDTISPAITKPKDPAITKESKAAINDQAANTQPSISDDFQLDDILSSVEDISPKTNNTQDLSTQQNNKDTSEEISVDDFMASSEEISVDDFMSSSSEVSLDDFMPSSSASGEISLDDFMGDSGFSGSPEKSPKAEKNDIIDDPPLDINLTFDDNFVLETKADPVSQLESVSFDGTSTEVSFDNFDDMFDNIVDESHSDSSQSVSTNTPAVSIPDMQEFDPSIFDDADLAAAISSATETPLPTDDNPIISENSTTTDDSPDISEEPKAADSSKTVDITDMFESIPDSSLNAKKEPETTSNVSESASGFGSSTEFDDFLKDLDNAPSAVSKAPEDIKHTSNKFDYDLTVTLDDVNEEEVKKQNNEDDYIEDIPLFGGSNASQQSITDPKKHLDISTNSSYTYTNELEVESIMNNMEDFGADISFEDITEPNAKPVEQASSSQEEPSNTDGFNFPVAEDLSETADLPNTDTENLSDISSFDSIPDIDSSPEIDKEIGSDISDLEPSIQNTASPYIDSNPIVEEPDSSVDFADSIPDFESNDNNVNLSSIDKDSEAEPQLESSDSSDSFDIPDFSTQDNIPTEQDTIPNIEQKTQDIMPNTTLNNTPEPKEAQQNEASQISSSMLNTILDELSKLRSEISSLKTDIDTIRQHENLPSQISNSGNETSTVEAAKPEPQIEIPAINTESEKPASTGSGFFSDDVEDETIALSGDELNNILNTADFTQEFADSSEPEEQNTVPADTSSNDIFTPDTQEQDIQESQNQSNDDFTPISDSENIDITSDDSVVSDQNENSFENSENIEPLESSEQPLTQDSSEPIIENDNSSTLSDQQQVSSETPNDNPDITPSDDDFYDSNDSVIPGMSFDDEKLEEPVLDDLNFSNNQEKESSSLPEEISVPTVEDILVEPSSTDFIEAEDPSISDTLTSDRIDYLSKDAMPEENIPEDISEISEPEQIIEPETIESLDETIEAPQVSELSENLETADSDIDNINAANDISSESAIPVDEEETSDEPTSQVFQSSQWDSSKTTEEPLDTESDIIPDFPDDIPDIIDEPVSSLTSEPTEDAFETNNIEDSNQNILSDESLNSTEPVDQASIEEPESNNNDFSDSSSIDKTTEDNFVAPEPLETKSETSDSLSIDSESAANDMPVELKHEIKSVLSYMDQLLENLPEEKIAEFAKSEHFDVYKKLFSELGLS